MKWLLQSLLFCFCIFHCSKAPAPCKALTSSAGMSCAEVARTRANYLTIKSDEPGFESYDCQWPKTHFKFLFKCNSAQPLPIRMSCISFDGSFLSLSLLATVAHSTLHSHLIPTTYFSPGKTTSRLPQDANTLPFERGTLDREEPPKATT